MPEVGGRAVVLRVLNAVDDNCSEHSRFCRQYLPPLTVFTGEDLFFDESAASTVLHPAACTSNRSRSWPFHFDQRGALFCVCVLAKKAAAFWELVFHPQPAGFCLHLRRGCF
jgi:hypothetical protein